MDALNEAAEALRNGELVAFATETVYGLGAHALDPEAVARVFELKQRPRFDPLIVHVPELEATRSLTRGWPAEAELLAEAFWPGPLTLVLGKDPSVPDLVTAGLDTVAIRCPDHELAQALLRKSALPLAAPSANRFGSMSPTRAEHVRAEFPGLRVLDGGPCSVGLESTIVSFARRRPALLRPGGLELSRIEALIGPLVRPAAHERTEEAPGRQSRHYAPNTPLGFTASSLAVEETGYLAFRKAPCDGHRAVEVLSESGDLREAASRLFGALRRLDASGAKYIQAEAVPEEGLGLAIMDRLRRAARP